MTTRRGQISVGCFAMPLACGTLILIMVVYCEFAVANLLFQSPCEAKKAYRQNIIGIAKTSMSRTECGLLCKKNDACNSFTYNRRSGLCLLSTGIEKNCNLLTNEADSQYFTAVSNAAFSNWYVNQSVPKSSIGNKRLCIMNMIRIRERFNHSKSTKTASTLIAKNVTMLTSWNTKPIIIITVPHPLHIVLLQKGWL